MNTSRACLAAAVVSSLCLAPVAAHAAPAPIPEQGLAISTSIGNCTLGYVDKEMRIGYTAAHCGREGDRVRIIDRTTNAHSREIGTFHPSTRYDELFSNDWGYIQWDRGVELGGNPYSGDAIIDPNDVKRGEEVCYHGETSHKGTKDTTCGTFYRATGESFAIRGAYWRPGDSGGPVWIPGRGFVGVASIGPATPGKVGTATVGRVRVEGKPMGWAAAPRDGRLIGNEEGTREFLAAAGLDSAGIYDELIDRSSKSSKGSSSESSSAEKESSSSEMTPGEILSIVIPILVVLVPLLAQLAQLAQQFMR